MDTSKIDGHEIQEVINNNKKNEVFKRLTAEIKVKIFNNVHQCYFFKKQLNKKFIVYM